MTGGSPSAASPDFASSALAEFISESDSNEADGPWRVVPISYPAAAKSSSSAWEAKTVTVKVPSSFCLR